MWLCFLETDPHYGLWLTLAHRLKGEFHVRAQPARRTAG